MEEKEMSPLPQPYKAYSATFKAYDYVMKEIKYYLQDPEKEDFENLDAVFYDKRYQYSIVDRIRHFARSDYFKKTDKFFPLLESILVKGNYVSDTMFKRADRCTKAKLEAAIDNDNLKELLVSIICGYYNTADENDALAQDQEIATINYYLCMLESLDPVLTDNLDVYIDIPNAIQSQIYLHSYAGFENVTFAQVMEGINNGTYAIDTTSNVIKRRSDNAEIGFFVHYESGFAGTKIEELLNNEYEAEALGKTIAKPIKSAENKTYYMKIDEKTGDSIEYDWQHVEIQKPYPEIKIFGYNVLNNDNDAYEEAMMAEAAAGNTSKIDQYNPPTAQMARQGWKESVSKWFDEKKIDNHPMDRLVTG